MGSQKQKSHYWSYPDAASAVAYTKEKLDLARRHHVRMHHLHRRYKKMRDKQTAAERDRACETTQHIIEELSRKDIWIYDKPYRGVAIFPCRVGQRTDEGVLCIQNAYFILYDTREAIETYITDDDSDDLSKEKTIPESWKTQKTGILMVEKSDDNS